MKLIAKKVTRSLPEYALVKQLYESAFPQEDRYPYFALRLLSLRKGVDFLAYFDVETFCGFTYSLENDDMKYVLYLAVDASLRSMGYGSAILSHLRQSSCGKTLALDCEIPDVAAPNSSQRLRRVAFYERNGFMDTRYIIREGGIAYQIMATSTNLNVERLKALMRGRVGPFISFDIEKLP